jgi:hypothetical protein
VVRKGVLQRQKIFKNDPNIFKKKKKKKKKNRKFLLRKKVFVNFFKFVVPFFKPVEFFLGDAAPPHQPPLYPGMYCP